MSKMFNFVVVAISLSACNSVYVKPNTLDPNEVFFVDAGGGLIRQGAKQAMERRGYNLTVGYKRAGVSTTYITSEGKASKMSEVSSDKARYIVYISESSSKFRPIWCSLNGFWWTRFNLSIADNITGQELLHWTGRGCTNSSIRLLERILDDLEK